VAVKPQALATSSPKFAKQLQGWRTKRGWTQVELAEQLGYSNALVSQLEQQRKAPSADFAAKCDEVFDTPGTFADLQELVAREAWPSYFAPVIDAETRAT
jgi:transcriptional regulator with XRE-family HTH domain